MTDSKNRTAVLIDVLYAVAIGINVWLLMDQMTGGELSREARKVSEAVTDRWRAKHKERQQLRRDAFEMFMQATEIVEEGTVNDAGN